MRITRKMRRELKNTVNPLEKLLIISLKTTKNEVSNLIQKALTSIKQNLNLNRKFN